MSEGGTQAMVPGEPGQNQALAYRHELSVEEVLARIAKVREVMKKAMEEGVHFGKVPGTDKPTLLKPGAELLNLIFRLDPQYHSDPAERFEDTGHLTIKSICTLWHIPTGQRMGSGEGSCSTRETKYAFRHGKRKCPKCGAEQINRSKYPPKDEPDGEPGWYCHAKGGGCGAQFPARDSAITSQEVGLVANPNLADTFNTVLKMANKRSLVAAVLNVTAASDTFTQDLEEMEENEATRRGETPPTHHGNGQSVTPPRADGSALVKAVDTKTGASKKGVAWTKYLVTFDDGRSGSTFDAKLAAMATTAKETGELLVPTLEQSGQFTNLTGLAPAGGNGHEGDTLTQQDKAKLWAIAKEHGWTADEVTELIHKAGFESSDLIPRSRASEIANTLKERRKPEG